MVKNYDRRLADERQKEKLRLQVEAQAERSRFDSKIQKQPFNVRISYNSWTDALTNEKFTWRLNVDFPDKMPKDEKMERFKKAIQDAFQEIYR